MATENVINALEDRIVERLEPLRDACGLKWLGVVGSDRLVEMLTEHAPQTPAVAVYAADWAPVSSGQGGRGWGVRLEARLICFVQEPRGALAGRRGFGRNPGLREIQLRACGLLHAHRFAGLPGANGTLPLSVEGVGPEEILPDRVLETVRLTIQTTAVTLTDMA